MLSGYNAAQLQEGGAAQLVDRLGDDSLTMRVLAIDNLRRVTGTHLMYRPDSAERIRSKYFERWQEQLANGEILYKERFRGQPYASTIVAVPTPGCSS